jgi:hypothetical protein
VVYGNWLPESKVRAATVAFGNAVTKTDQAETWLDLVSMEFAAAIYVSTTGPVSGPLGQHSHT